MDPGVEGAIVEATTATPPAPAQATEGLEARMTRAVEAAPQPVETTQAERTQQAATPEAGWQGVREYARAQGLELPYEDDGAALNDLIRARQQLAERNAYAELGQRLSPHAAAIQEFLRQRQAPAPAQDAPAWAAPPFKKEWLQQVERDESSGQLRAKPGFDPAVVERVQAYADWRDRFLDNPEQVVAPLIEVRAREIVRGEIAEQRQQDLANQLVQRNAAWLYRRDQAGRAVVDPRTGQPQFTPAGVVYAQEARRVYDSGVTDVRVMDHYARLAAENAALRGHFQQSQPAATAPAVPSSAPAGPAVGGHAARPAPAVPAVPASQAGLSLEERLRVNLKDAPHDLAF